MHDAIGTDLDVRTNLLIIEKYGQELYTSKSGFKLLYSFADQI